jgi:predicted GNAT family N-acyltransferase
MDHTSINQDLEIIAVQTKDQLEACFFVRTEVFHKEQGVDKALDFDGKDESSHNVLALMEGEVAATMRLRDIGEKKLKLERLAVLAQFRRKSIASALIEYASKEAKKIGKSEIILHAQVNAKALYEKAGYQAIGEEFLEAGIRHIEMIKEI